MISTKRETSHISQKRKQADINSESKGEDSNTENNFSVGFEFEVDKGFALTAGEDEQCVPLSSKTVITESNDKKVPLESDSGHAEFITKPMHSHKMEIAAESIKFFIESTLSNNSQQEPLPRRRELKHLRLPIKKLPVQVDQDSGKETSGEENRGIKFFKGENEMVNFLIKAAALLRPNGKSVLDITPWEGTSTRKVLSELQKSLEKTLAQYYDQ